MRHYRIDSNFCLPVESLPNIAIDKLTGEKIILQIYYYNLHIPKECRDVSKDGLYYGPGSGTIYFHVMSGDMLDIHAYIDIKKTWDNDRYFYVHDGLVVDTYEAL